MPSVTVFGADNAVLSVSLDGTTNYQLAQQFAAMVNGAAAAGTLSASILSDAGLPPVPTGFLGEAQMMQSGSNLAFPSGYATLLDLAAGATTISAVAATGAISVLAGAGGITFNDGPQRTTFIAGGGNNIFNGFNAPDGTTTLPGAGSSNLDMVATGPGNDTISTGSDNFDVDAGTGANTIVLGDGINYVNSLGQDLIMGGPAHTTAGVPDASTIYLSGTNATVVGGSGLLHISNTNGIASPGGGGDTITLGSGGGSISGVANSLFNLAGNVTVTAGGNDTINVGGAVASLTGGAAGPNIYEFMATATGGATDVITDFKTTDKLSISGYAANGAAVLNTATVSGGSTTITLSDQTKIVLQNFTTLTGGNFS